MLHVGVNAEAQERSTPYHFLTHIYYLLLTTYCFPYY